MKWIHEEWVWLSLQTQPLYLCPLLWMDTGVVEKDAKSDYRPGFMQHFDKKMTRRRLGGNRAGPQGPHEISLTFQMAWTSETLKTLTQPQLEEYMSALDRHMDQELESLRKRYHQKRLPILRLPTWMPRKSNSETLQINYQFHVPYCPLYFVLCHGQR